MDLISQLPFDLIKPTTYSILRIGRGSEVDGEWVTPSPVTTLISAVISPYIKRDVVETLPETLRKRKVIRIFSNIELKEHIDTGAYEADQLDYAGERYRVFKLGSWINVNGYTGYEAYAVRAEAKEFP